MGRDGAPGRARGRAGPAALALLAICALALAGDVPVGGAGAPQLGYRVVRVLPHDPSAFTEGLLWYRGRLYESTGLVGASSLREVDPSSGRVLREVAIPPPVFAEGLALWQGRLYQLSWTQHLVMVWGLDCFCRLATEHLAGEGWGLTASPGGRLYESDGSGRLRIFQPGPWRETGALPVVSPGARVSSLNELEWTPSGIFANVWPSDAVDRIDPTTGRLTGRLDLSRLGDGEDRADPENVPNGIAYIPSSGHLLVTGKRWRHAYELQLGGT